MNMEALIQEKIEAAFTPESLELINESAKHKGHGGDDGSGQTHFKLKVVSSSFANQTRIQRHQAVYKALDGLFQQGLHALSVTAVTPEE